MHCTHPNTDGLASCNQPIQKDRATTNYHYRSQDEANGTNDGAKMALCYNSSDVFICSSVICLGIPGKHALFYTRGVLAVEHGNG